MDRRRFLRVPISLDVVYIHNNVSQKGKIKDLSYGGVFVYSKTPPPLDSIVSIIFTIEDTEPPIKLFLKGNVVRSVPGEGFALKFTEISPESLTHLKNFLYYNSPSPEEIETQLKEFLGEAYPLINIVKSIQISVLKEELLKHILKRAFFYSPKEPFILSSGEKSPYYLDCRKVTLYAPAFSLVGELFWQEIQFLNIQSVAGMSIGADPIVCAILSKATEQNIDLEGLFVRKEPKKYGTKKQIEGNVIKGHRVVVVEDVVTTGNSVLKAVKILEDAGLKIVKIISLVDREAGGKENITSQGYNYLSFFTLSEIIKASETNAK